MRQIIIAALFVFVSTHTPAQEITDHDLVVYKSEGGGEGVASWSWQPADSCLAEDYRIPTTVLWLASREDTAVVVDYHFEGQGRFVRSFRIRLPATEAHLWEVRYADSSVTVQSRLDANGDGLLDISDFSAAMLSAANDWRVFQHFTVYWSRSVRYNLTLEGGGSMDD